MELFDAGNVLIWRALERLVNVLIGALAIYLGYRLFMNLPERREEQEGRMKLLLPGDISVYVSRVGPGVFFAIFGTAIVLTSFAKTLSFDRQPSSAPAEEQAAETRPAAADSKSSFSYIGSGQTTQRHSAERAVVQRDLLSLRKLEEALGRAVADGSPILLAESDSAALLNALPRIKGSLLLRVWDEKWGDAEAFAGWVQAGAFGPLPAGLQEVGSSFTPLEKRQSAP